MKKVAFRYTTLGVPEYRFNLEPLQLATLVFEIERLKDAIGAIVEIGVARGMTTRFLCEHLVKSGYTHQDLYALDTFSSFLARDVDFEVAHRGKTKGDLKGHFGYNDFETWKRTFRSFPFVKAVQGDCATFDYATIAPIKLALLDVDLYLPIKHALPKLYKHLRVGGVILVDDVLRNTLYDGAYQAYTEFCNDANIHPTVVGNKFGIIRK
jgi:Macrocin-O-methyltransferase (TylF)